MIYIININISYVHSNGVSKDPLMTGQITDNLTFFASHSGLISVQIQIINVIPDVCVTGPYAGGVRGVRGVRKNPHF